MSELKVTTLEDLKKYAMGAVVEFPPFAEGQPFVARVKRPSMLDMIKSKKFPNELLTVASSLFTDGKASTGKVLSNTETMNNLLDIVDIMARECLIEPTLKDIKDSNLTLTDDQRLFLFNYIQTGVKDLKPFREEQGHPESSNNVSTIQQDAKRNFKHKR